MWTGSRSFSDLRSQLPAPRAWLFSTQATVLRRLEYVTWWCNYCFVFQYVITLCRRYYESAEPDSSGEMDGSLGLGFDAWEVEASAYAEDGRPTPLLPTSPAEKGASGAP